jgi:hypothetical protein
MSARRRELPPHCHDGERPFANHGRTDRTSHLCGRPTVLAEVAALQIDGSGDPPDRRSLPITPPSATANCPYSLVVICASPARQ